MQYSLVKKDRVTTSKTELILQILLIFILPVALIKFGIIPISMRIPVLVAVAALTLFVLIKEKWTLNMFHVDMQSVKKYYPQYILFTVVGVVMISVLGENLGKEEIARWWTYPHFLYLFFVVSLFQEILYRGYLIPALQKLLNETAVVILCNTIIFTFMHMLFQNPQVGLPLAFIGGIGFATMYIRYPSLPLIVLSHAVLNFCALLYGFFLVHGGI